MTKEQKREYRKAYNLKNREKISVQKKKYYLVTKNTMKKRIKTLLNGV